MSNAAALPSVKVGHRYLLKIRSHSWSSIGDTHEYIVLEIAPSGKRVKLRGFAGQTYWEEVENFDVIEELNSRRTFGRLR